MKLTLDELAKKYIAGTMTDTDLEESGYEIHQVEALAETLKNSTNTEATPFKFGSTKTGIHHITSFNKFEV